MHGKKLHLMHPFGFTTAGGATARNKQYQLCTNTYIYDDNIALSDRWLAKKKEEAVESAP